MMRKSIIFLLISITGCASTKFQIINTSEISNSKIEVIDNRIKISKKGGKKSILDTYYYHSDNSIVPSKITLLKQKVIARFGKNVEKVITLHKFEVIDHYANRMGAAQSASLASSGFFTPSNWDSRDDFIRCEIEVTIDNKRYYASHSSAYHLKGNKMIVFDESSYKTAVKEAITNALLKLFK